jgi:hypothetical protein
VKVFCYTHSGYVTSQAGQAEKSCGIGNTPLNIVIKRLLSISFVFALLANGLGSVMAANWCLYQRCKPAVSENKHTTSHEAKASDDSHCSGYAKVSEHGDHKAAASKQAQPSPGKELVALKRLGPHCGHCVSAPQSPARSRFKAPASESRRDAGSDTSQIVRRFILPGVASFPALAPSQGAPPVPSARRHLLINVFLI